MKGIEILDEVVYRDPSLLRAIICTISLIIVITLIDILGYSQFVKSENKHGLKAITAIWPIILVNIIAVIGIGYGWYESTILRTKYTIKVDETASYIEFIETYRILKELPNHVYVVERIEGEVGWIK